MILRPIILSCVLLLAALTAKADDAAPKQGEKGKAETTPVPAPKPETSVFSATLDLSKFVVGDLLPKELGKDCLVAEEKEGSRYIRGRTDAGEIKIEGITLEGNFHVELTAQNITGGFTFALLAKDGSSIPVKLDANRSLCFGEEKSRLSIVADEKQLWKPGKANILRLQSDGKAIKCFINGTYWATVPYPDKGAWQAIHVSGITKKTKITALSAECQKDGKP